MSAGTQVYSVRINPHLMRTVMDQIASLNVHSPRGEWTLTDFITQALREKLKKMQRSRTKRVGRKPGLVALSL